MTPSERTPARRRAAALAILSALVGGCAAPAPTTTPVDPIELHEDDGVTPGGAAGAEPVPLPDPEPAGEGGATTTTEPPPTRAPADGGGEPTPDVEPDQVASSVEDRPSGDDRATDEPSEDEGHGEDGDDDD